MNHNKTTYIISLIKFFGQRYSRVSSLLLNYVSNVISSVCSLLLDYLSTVSSSVFYGMQWNKKCIENRFSIKTSKLTSLPNVSSRDFYPEPSGKKWNKKCINDFSLVPNVSSSVFYAMKWNKKCIENRHNE